jgi:hypothetical protein
MIGRPYDPERDREQAIRVWYETGWLRPERPQMFDAAASRDRALVAEIAGDVECVVLTARGSLRYLATGSLPFAGVMAVTTSRVGRRQGLAARLTAEAVAADAAAGATVAGLGIFDQGFYDRLGFGCGGYEHWLAIDPAALLVDDAPPRPLRLGQDDFALVHACRLARTIGHGGLCFDAPEVSRTDMVKSEHGFGLGYREGDVLTHHLWCQPEADNRNLGPFRVTWMAYRNGGQLRQLLALLRDLGDQALLVRLREPPGVQLQDLLARPFRGYARSDRSRFELRNDARAYWQMRICDLAACVSATSVDREVRFNLELEDPIERYLDASAPWRGVGGRYVVNLGPASTVSPGGHPSLPTLRAGVGAFTRLWLGVRPATGLAVTDRLEGPAALLKTLDEVLRLPEPRPDWDF